jgi:hypothetical protein
MAANTLIYDIRRHIQKITAIENQGINVIHFVPACRQAGCY